MQGLKIGVVFAALALSVVTVGAQASTPAQQEVLRVQAQRLKALIEQDSRTLESMIADELSYAHSTGAVDNKSSYLTFVRAQKYLKFDPQGMNVGIYGDVAVVTGRLRFTLVPYKQTEAASLDLRTIEVYVKRGSRWQFAHFQSTVMGDLQAPAPRPSSAPR